jgi:hypothetical protein
MVTGCSNDRHRGVTPYTVYLHGFLYAVVKRIPGQFIQRIVGKCDGFRE